MAASNLKWKYLVGGLLNLPSTGDFQNQLYKRVCKILKLVGGFDLTHLKNMQTVELDHESPEVKIPKKNETTI